MTPHIDLHIAQCRVCRIIGNFSIEGEELLSEENLTDNQSTENRLDEQSLQQRKSDRSLDVSQDRDYHENKTFFGISLGRRILKYSTSFLDNIVKLRPQTLSPKT